MSALRKVLFVLLIDIAVLAFAELALRVADAVHPAPWFPRGDIHTWPPPCEPTPGEGNVIDCRLRADRERDGSDPDPAHAFLAAQGSLLGPGDLPPEGRRVFVVGESVAAGVGLPYARTYAALLEDRLAGRGPVRVFMAAQSGTRSCFVARQALTILRRFDPDLLIVFAGNNEFLDWTYPLGTSVQTDLVLFRETVLRPLRTYQSAVLLYHRLTGTQVGRSGYLSTLFATDRCFEPAQVLPRGMDLARWHEIRDAHLAALRERLDAVIREAKSRGVPVLVATMPIQYRLPPCYCLPQPEHFLTDRSRAAEIEGLLASAWDRWRGGDYAGALDLARRAVGIDPRSALANHLEGRCLDALGRPGEALDAYARARENTVGWLGSMLSVNRTLAALAADEDVPLVDLAALFEAAQRRRPDGPALISDDCHPSESGAILVADAFYAAVAPLLDARAPRVRRGSGISP